jgi:hypothetical protein
MTKVLFAEIGRVGYEVNSTGTTISGTRTHGKGIKREDFVSKFVATLGTTGVTRH